MTVVFLWKVKMERSMASRDPHGLETSSMLTWFPFQSRAESSHGEQSAQNWLPARCIVQDGASRLPQLLDLADGICLVETENQLDERGGQGCMESCEVRSSSPRTSPASPGCSAEAAVIVLCSGPILVG